MPTANGKEDRSEWLFEHLKTPSMEEDQCINHCESISFHAASSLDPEAILLLQSNSCEKESA